MKMTTFQWLEFVPFAGRVSGSLTIHRQGCSTTGRELFSPLARRYISPMRTNPAALLAITMAATHLHAQRSQPANASERAKERASCAEWNVLLNPFRRCGSAWVSAWMRSSSL